MTFRTEDTSWTKVAYPLKLEEYLASGRAVVSVDLPMLTPLRHVTRFARGIEDWIRALDEVIEQSGVGTRELRQAAAAGHSWDHRMAVLEEWFGDLISNGLDESPQRSRQAGAVIQ